jgi:hypothetical protein
MPEWISVFECDKCGEFTREEDWVVCEGCGIDICDNKCTYQGLVNGDIVEMCEDCYVTYDES